MAFVSVTRLRLRSVRFLPGFARYAIRSLAQVRQSAGLIDGSLQAEGRFVFWTMTRWNSMEHMRGYMNSGAHKESMPKLMHWCDEASVVHWDDAAAKLPPWDEAERRMRTDGRASKVLHPSPLHASLRFAPRRPWTTGPILPRKR